jgi:hypothetical protein
VEVRSKVRQPAIHELTVLMDGVAAEDDRRLAPEAFAEGGEGMVEIAFGNTRGDTVEKAACAMVLLAPVIHVFEDG